jgi:hypothetical protein
VPSTQQYNNVGVEHGFDEGCNLFIQVSTVYWGVNRLLKSGNRHRLYFLLSSLLCLLVPTFSSPALFLIPSFPTSENRGPGISPQINLQFGL